MLRPSLFASLVPVLALMMALSACSKNEGGSDSGGQPPATDAKSLVANDIAQLATLQSSSAQAFDSEYKNTFSQIFGGTSGAAVRAYLDTRIKYYYTMDELDSFQISPTNFQYNGWSGGSNSPGIGSEMADFGSQLVARSLGLADSSGAEIGALNIGTALWYQAIINRVPVIIRPPSGSAITIDSSRVGLMVIGPGYRASIPDDQGDEIQLPSAYRQAILLHEARHSDCTGGVTDQDLDIARKATSSEGFVSVFPKKACGHLHVYCPEGHDFAGLPACDDQPWGAYAVEAVFSATRAREATGRDRAIMETEAIDRVGRLINFNVDDMFAGRLGNPDMTSSGYTK